MLVMATLVSLSASCRHPLPERHPRRCPARPLVAGLIYLIPAVRSRVEALADWFGGLYERASGWALRRLPSTG